MLSIGLMSGTSMDGIDAALLETDGEDHIVALGRTSIAYAPEMKTLLKAAELAINACKGDLKKAALCYFRVLQDDYLAKELKLDLAEISQKIPQLMRYLRPSEQLDELITLAEVIQFSTRLHAEAVQKLLAKTAKHASDIDVIGYHGQTMFHKPRLKMTVQIGYGERLAELTNITVVNDFRRHDVAAGGQGAPFAPIYHQALAKRDGKIPLAVVNCGGIANISLIVGEDLESIIGFDVGPGNGLIDALIRKRTHGQEFMDKDGQYGSKGIVNDTVLAALFANAISADGENYFALPAPKSLDIRDMVLLPELAQLTLEDACATLEVFTAKTMVKSLELVNLTREQMPRYWVLAGGGWHNPVIRNAFEKELKAQFDQAFMVQTANEVGWDSQAMEAQIFAYFAVRSLKNLPLSVPGTTKVPVPLTGGQAYLPPGGATTKVAKLLAANPVILVKIEAET